MKYLISEDDLVGDPEFIVMLTKLGAPADYYTDADCVYVPERIMWRLIGIGKAYNLKFVAHVSPNSVDRWVYPGQMLSWVIDEFSFILNLVNDPVLQIYVQKIIGLFIIANSNKNQLQVVFEGP
jgi:hypothetical protein